MLQTLSTIITVARAALAYDRFMMASLAFESDETRHLSCQARQALTPILGEFFDDRFSISRIAEDLRYMTSAPAY